MQKMINFDDVTKANIQEPIQIGKFLITHTEYWYLEILDLEKQIHYLI